jgi:hypothetical protein
MKMFFLFFLGWCLVVGVFGWCLVVGVFGLYGILNVFGKNDEKNPYESICVFAYVIVIRDKMQPFQFVEF